KSLLGFPIVSRLNSRELLQSYQAGESSAAAEIFDRYVARLLGLARDRIGPRLRRRVDAEDVVQSAYRSFFVHAKDGAYRLTEQGDLWRLLASITLHKLHRQIERHAAAKRSLDREAALESTHPQAAEPSPAEVIAVAEELHRALDRLKPDERLVL